MNLETLFKQTKLVLILVFQDYWLKMVAAMAKNKHYVEIKKERFLELRYRIFWSHRSPAKFETAIRAKAKGNSIHSTARIVQVERDTASNWLNRAAILRFLTTIHLWQNWNKAECQLDELLRFVHVFETNLVHVKHYYQSYGDAWIWGANATPFRVVLAFVVGLLPQNLALRIDERVKYVTDNLNELFHE